MLRDRPSCTAPSLIELALLEASGTATAPETARKAWDAAAPSSGETVRGSVTEAEAETGRCVLPDDAGGLHCWIEADLNP